MSTDALVLLAIGFGVVVGVTFTLILRWALDAAETVYDLQAASLPDGAAAVVGALAMPALVVDGSDTLLQATDGAIAMGLVADRRLAHPALRQLVDAARTEHQPQRSEMTLPHPAGSGRGLLVAASAAPVDASRVLLVVEDRSDAVRVEAMRRDFVANVSHELKTPIGAVSLLAEALEGSADDPERVRRFAGRLSAEAARLGALVQEILDFSRLQDREPEEGEDLVSLDDVLAAAADRSRVAADARAVSVVVGKRTGLHARGDAAQLTTAVQNLVANAIAFSPTRTHVGVGLRSRDGVVEIAVSDQGTGIDQHELDRVFERFYRSDQARSRRTGGTGLGLSIVKHIAENHGGDVTVWSRPGRGSTFTIRLPQSPAPADTGGKRRKKEHV